MERYFIRYPNDEARAVLHYQCNLQLAEAFYTSLSVFEVTLRNALSREMYGAQNEMYIEGWTEKGLNLLIYKRLCNI